MATLRAWLWNVLHDYHDETSAASAALGVLAAFAGVVVAIRYVVLTRRLWKATNAQGDLTRAIAEVTKRQAEISQSLVEASHRPYIEVSTREAWFSTPTWYRFKLHIANRGLTPAVDLTWSVRVSNKDGTALVQRASEADGVIFPGQVRDFYCVLEEGTPASQEPAVQVDLRVAYLGTSGRRYYTALTMSGSQQHGWVVSTHEIGWINQVSAEGGGYGISPG
jgi:hypothetical protein